MRELEIIKALVLYLFRERLDKLNGYTDYDEYGNIKGDEELTKLKDLYYEIGGL